MSTRRLISRVPLESLRHRFEEIRQESGVSNHRSAAALAEVEAGNRDEDPAHIAGPREDLTSVPFVTLDPEGSTDLDQAVHIERSASGWRVRYAIADVAAHVIPGGAVDAEAWARVETVYCPDVRVGLHPPALSEGYASLLPGQRTKAVVWDLAVGRDGSLGTATLSRAWVTSTRQFSYDELAHTPPADAAEFLEVLREVGEARRRALHAAGAVTLPKPSQEVDRTDAGLELVFRAGTPIEDDNAQISLLTGSAAARMMLEAGVGVLRTMPPASDAALERLRRQALALGVEWRATESYAEVLTRIDPASARGAAFVTAAVGLFRGAAWQAFDVRAGMPAPEPATHGALAAPYAHVTAPLRRLVDRYATEICLAHDAGRDIPSWVTDALPRLGDVMTGGVRRGAKVDRACVEAVEAAVLAPHIGEEFEGIGLDEDTVQLASPAVVARCSGTVAVGRPQRVRLVSADPVDGPRFAAVT